MQMRVRTVRPNASINSSAERMQLPYIGPVAPTAVSTASSALATYSVPPLALHACSPDKINKLVRSKADSRFFECAVVYFTARHPYLHDVLVHITAVYNADDWVTAGPKPLTTIYYRLDRRNATYLPGQVHPGAWLGLRWKQAKKVFWPTGRVRMGDYVGCEVVHLWGSVARGYMKANTVNNNFTYLNGPEKARLVAERLDALRNVPYCRGPSLPQPQQQPLALSRL
jgi:hypothetical protein